MGVFAWTYPAYQLEFTVFFSHNKTASVNLSVDFNTNRTGPIFLPIPLRVRGQRFQPLKSLQVTTIVYYYYIYPCTIRIYIYNMLVP